MLKTLKKYLNLSNDCLKPILAFNLELSTPSFLVEEEYIDQASDKRIPTKTYD